MKTFLTIHEFSKSLGFFCLFVFFFANMLLICQRVRGVPESGKASKPEEPARKPQTVREYHRAHEAEHMVGEDYIFRTTDICLWIK